MIRFVSAGSLFAFLCVALATAGADSPQVVELWPGTAPEEPGTIGAEYVRMSPQESREKLEVTEPTRLVTNVTKPTLTIYRPGKDKGTGTAVLICPGGGYWNLYWQLEGEEVAAWLNSLGVTGIILKYRVPRRPGEVTSEPARRPLQDAQRAVSLVRSKAKDWGIDPHRIGIIGFSAGGHLALATATSFEKRTYATVDDIDKVDCRPDFAIPVYSGYLKPKDKDELSPGLTIPPRTPPVFLVHGGADTVSPPEHSVIAYLALRRAGVPTELHVYANTAHDFGVRSNDRTYATWTDLCARWLRSQGFLTPNSRRAAEAVPPVTARPAEPVSPNASPEARALLQYLYRISGKYTLTGQHNFPNTADASTQAAFRAFGKVPAVFGQDFGFAKAGDKDSYLARPAIIEEIKRQHQKGAIISLCWHAVRPTDDEPVTFRRSVQGKLTDEQFQELLTPGTKLHESWCAQVDAVAGFLKQLEAAHVPVLWRPYHEMNGDWFWWGGRGGAGPYTTSALYRQMFDRYVNHHNLTNLIWVWSVDRPTNPRRQFADYFPGPNAFDVASLDVYGNDFKPVYYDGLLKLAAGKPIGLAEVGRAPALAVLEEQPKWTWWMVWAGMVGSGRSTKGRTNPVRDLFDNPRSFSLSDSKYIESIAPIRAACGLPQAHPAPRPPAPGGRPASVEGPDVLAPGARPELLQERGAGEGPAWHPKLGLLTSGGGDIVRRALDGKVSIYRKGVGSNGLMFDRQGRLVICEAANRRVTRIENDGRLTILADRYDGHRFNQPNDLTLDSLGRIYFSDPCYGNRRGMEMLDADGRKVEGVYRIDPDGRVSRIIAHEADRPNGLVVTPDDRTLYVADNNNDNIGGARKLWRFALRPDGTVAPASRTLVHDWGVTRGPDGIKLDAAGRLFVAAGLNRPNPPYETQEKPTAGVYVFSPAGELLQTIPIPRDECTNCAFGGDDLKTLFVTAGGTLWAVRLNQPGRTVWDMTR